MLFELIKDALLNNNLFYSVLLMLNIASFSGAIIIVFTKSFQIMSNNYYTYLFEKDLWTQSLEKNINNAKEWNDKSTLVRMFSEGFKLFITNYRKNNDYNGGSNIELTKNTMRVVLYKDYERFSHGFNWLTFNAVFIPYCLLLLSIYDVVLIFQSVSISVLELSMFVKPLIILMFGLLLTGVTVSVFYIYQTRMEIEQNKLELFINEFGNFLHRNFYEQSND